MKHQDNPSVSSIQPHSPLASFNPGTSSTSTPFKLESLVSNELNSKQKTSLIKRPSSTIEEIDPTIFEHLKLRKRVLKCKAIEIDRIWAPFCDELFQPVYGMTPDVEESIEENQQKLRAAFGDSSSYFGSIYLRLF